MSELAVKIEHVSKQYRLGAIGGGTLKGDLQTWMAKMRGKEDPNSKIGAAVYTKNEKFLALDDINLEIKKGEAVGIIGHNGAGKSTLLKLITRVTAPTTGNIYLNGRVASMLEVGTGFHPELSGRDNVYLNGAILGMKKSEIKDKFEEIVEFSEVRQFIDTPVKRYSSGMYVKLAFSVAAHLDSEIMIMDEVLAVGDVKFQQKCLDKMSEAAHKDGRTVLYVSHNMSTIRRLCDRCIVLEKGKIIFDGDVNTAIQYYLDSSDIKYDTDIDLSDKRMEHLPSDIIAKMTRIQLLDKKSPTYEIYEHIRFKLWISSIQDVKKLSARIEIRCNDGSSVAASILQNFSFLTVGDNVFTFDLDPTGLVPGKYFALLVIYEVSENGIYDDFDAIYPTFAFEVVDTNNSLEVKWNFNTWGRIKLPIMEFEKHDT